MRAQFVIPVLASILILGGLFSANNAQALDFDFLFKFGSLGSLDGQFIFPSGVAVDPVSQNILVVDRDNHRIQVFSISLNQPPNANNDSPETLANISVDVQVLDNDTDPDEDSLSIVSTSNGPSNGNAAIVGDVITYTPNADFVGFDSFDYTISDNNGGFDTATVTVEVLSAADGSQNLIDLINTIGAPAGTETSLAAPLGNASDLLNDVNTNNDAAACGKLDAFINHVNAEEGSTLTSVEAALLRGLAEDVKTSIGC